MSENLYDPIDRICKRKECNSVKLTELFSAIALVKTENYIEPSDELFCTNCGDIWCPPQSVIDLWHYHQKNIGNGKSVLYNHDGKWVSCLILEGRLGDSEYKIEIEKDGKKQQLIVNYETLRIKMPII